MGGGGAGEKKGGAKKQCMGGRGGCEKWQMNMAREMSGVPRILHFLH